MCPSPPGSECRYIVVADEDRAVVNFVIETLLKEGHAVFQAYDGRMALELALGLKVCDLVISNTRVGGMPGPDLIDELRRHLPGLAIIFMANPGTFEPELEARLPDDVPVLHEPFTAEALCETVNAALAHGPRLVRDGLPPSSHGHPQRGDHPQRHEPRAAGRRQSDHH